MLKTGIVDDPILPGKILADFPSQEDGACLLFLGVVRNHNLGREVSGLEYQAYRAMAEKTLTEIGTEASRRFGTDRITVLHRIGTLRVGEVSTAIAVATPHRAEGYEASRYIIEELKKRLPVWKRERYVAGEAAWLGESGPGPLEGESAWEGEGGTGPAPSPAVGGGGGEDG